MKDIAENIKGHLKELNNSKNSNNDRKEYSIYFVPRRTMICERVLEDEDVYNGIFIYHSFLHNLKELCWENMLWN